MLSETFRRTSYVGRAKSADELNAPAPRPRFGTRSHFVDRAESVDPMRF